MSKLISSANASIKVVDDASYMVNDALHINAVFQRQCHCGSKY